MGFCVLGRYPYENKRERYLVLDLARGALDWRFATNELKIDCEYSDNFSQILKGPQSTLPEIRRFFWQNKNKEFSGFYLHHLPPNSKYQLDLNKELWINGQRIGIISEFLPQRELITINNPNNPSILLIIEKKNYTILRAFERPDDYVSSYIEDNHITTNKTNKRQKNDRAYDQTGSLENHLINLIQKPLEPIRESLDKLERKMQDYVVIRDTILKMDMRIRNLSIGNPAQGPSSYEEVEYLKRELDEHKQKLTSMEMALNDATVRLKTTETTILDRLKNLLHEPIVQMQVYSEPDLRMMKHDRFGQIIEEFRQSSLDKAQTRLHSELNENITSIIEQNEHLMHVISLLMKRFEEIGWIPKR